jgi:hypothetical protein
MKKIILSILLITLLFSCAQQTNETTAAFEEESKKERNIEVSEEASEMDNIQAYEMTPLEYIILGKLQEIYDLQNIIADSTINNEIRNEAKTALQGLLLDTETLEQIKGGSVSNVKITDDSSHVTFELDNQTMEADVDVSKEVMIIEGESVDNLEITIEEIR